MLLYPPRPDAVHEECHAAVRRAARVAREEGLARPHLLGALLPFLVSPAMLACVWMAGRTALPWNLAWLFAAGWLLTVLGLIGHDCTHNACAPTARTNYWMGAFLFSHHYMTYEAYRILHLSHHRLNAKDEDPSGDSPKLQKQTNLLTHLLFILIPAGFPFFQILPGWIAGLGYYPTGLPSVNRRRVATQLLGVVAMHGLFLWALTPPGYVWYLGAFGVASFLVMQFLGFNHVEIEAYTDCTLCNTRNVSSNAIVRLMSLYTGFHVEHHLVPAVPWYRLPRLNALLERERPGGATYTVRGFLHAHARVIWIHLQRLLGRLPPESAEPARR